MSKRGLGPVVYGGTEMPWGKGAVAGGFVFVSGSDPRDENTGRPVSGVVAQVQIELDRIRETLEQAGATMDNVVKFVWYLKDRSLIDDFYAGRDSWLATHARDLLESRSYASTMLIVELGDPEMLVEIDCYAFIG